MTHRDSYHASAARPAVAAGKTTQAIALHYDGQRAPRVTAKGEAEVAERILALAQAHDVPIHADVELTGLLARVALDDEIPPSLFVAIAEVLAFTYRLKGKAPGD